MKKVKTGPATLGKQRWWHRYAVMVEFPGYGYRLPDEAFVFTVLRSHAELEAGNANFRSSQCHYYVLRLNKKGNP